MSDYPDPPDKPPAELYCRVEGGFGMVEFTDHVNAEASVASNQLLTLEDWR